MDPSYLKDFLLEYQDSNGKKFNTKAMDDTVKRIGYSHSDKLLTKDEVKGLISQLNK